MTAKKTFMSQFLEFVVNHWILCSLLVGLLVTLVYTESLKRGASVSMHEATRIMNQENGVVVDLRSAQEFADGHIAGAINLPAAELGSRVSELDKHKDAAILLVCKMGQHSSAASRSLKEAGFSNVRRIDGGMAEWTNANMPVVKGGAKGKGKDKEKQKGKSK